MAQKYDFLKYFLITRFCLCLLFCIPFFVKSQSITSFPITNIPENVIACGEPAEFSFVVYGPLAASSQISVQLPNGTEAVNVQSSSNEITLSNANTNNPIFTVTNALNTNSDFIEVKYLVQSGCNSIPSNSQITHSLVGTNITQSINFPTVLYSALEILNITPESATLNAGETTNFDVTIQNNSISPLAYTKNIVLKITHSENVIIAYNGTGSILSSSSTETIIELDASEIETIGNLNDRFEDNELINIPIEATIIGCPSEAGETISYEVAYGGCLTSNTFYCYSNNVNTSGIQKIDGSPNLVTRVIEKGYPTFCEPGTTKMSVTNNGTGALYDLNINLGFHGGTTVYIPQGRTYFYFENAHIEGDNQNVNLTNSFVNYGEASHVLFTEFAPTSDPDGPGGISDLDGDGFYDDLPAGESFNLIFDIVYDLATRESEISSNCHNSNYLNINYDYLRWSQSYTNDCGTLTSFFTNALNSGFYRPLAINSVSSTSNLSDISSPNLVNGDQFNLNIDIGADQTNLFLNFPNLRWRITLQLPPGISPNGNGIRSDSDGFVDEWVLISFDSTLGQAIYEIQNANSSSQRLDLLNSFPLQLDCAGGLSGVHNIPFTIQLLPNDPNCDHEPNIFCDNSITFTIYCPIDPCPAVVILEQSLERITLGYTDDSETTLVNPDTVNNDSNPDNDIYLNRVVNGDEVLLNTLLQLYGDPLDYESAIVTLRYSQSNIFRNQYDGGMKSLEFTHTSNSTGISTTYDVSAFYNYNYGSICYHTVDIVQWANASGVVLNSADTIEVNMVLKVPKIPLLENSTDSFIPNVGTEVPGLVLEVPTNNNGVNYNCNPKALSLFSIGLFNFLYTYDQSVNLNGCSNPNVSVTFQNTSMGSTYGQTDFFPNEFRAIFNLKKFAFYLPNGVSYNPGTSRYFYNRSQNTPPFGVLNFFEPIQDPIITFDAIPGFTKYQYNNDGTWPLNDLPIHRWGGVRIFLNIQANCLLDENLQTFPYIFSPETEFEVYRNNPDEETLSFETINNGNNTTFNKTFNYIPVQFSISSDSQTYTTSTNTAQWPLTISNTTTSGAAADNIWIAIEIPNNNIIPTLWDGTTEIPLVSYGAGKYWGQAGSVDDIKTFYIKSENFNVCTSQLLVRVGQNCAGYPIDPNHTYDANGFPYSCDNEKTSIFYLNVQQPKIQVSSNLGQNGNSFNFCDPISYFDLTIKNVANGFAYDLIADLEFPSGLILIGSASTVLYGGNSFPIPDSAIIYDSATNTYSINLNLIPGLVVGEEQGLPGISSGLQTNIVLHLGFSFTCDFIAGTSIFISVNANSPCNEPLPSENGFNQIQTLPININQVPSNLEYDLDLSSDLTEVSQSDQVINFSASITNQGQNITDGQIEKIVLVMDDTFSFQSGSTVNIINGPSSDPIITQDAISGTTSLTWPMQNGVLVGNVMQFNFNIIAPSLDSSICKNYDFNLSTRILLSIDCPENQNLSCNELQTITNQETISFPIKYLNIESASICPGETYTFDVGPNFAQYQWSTGSTEQSITTGSEGTYTITASTGDDCTVTKEVELTYYEVITGVVNCSEITQDQITFTWTDLPEAESYTYEYSIDGGTLITGTTADTFLEISGLNQGQNVVISITPNSTTAYLCFETFSTNCTTLICEIGEVSCGTITDSSVEFLWPSIPNAESYSYQYSIDGGTPISGSTTETSLEISGLEQGQTVSITIIPTSTSSAFCFEIFTADCTTLICEIGEVSCGTITDSSVEFIWPTIPNAESYTYEYSIDGDAPVSGSTVNTTLEVTGLEQGQTVSITIIPTSTSSAFCFENFSADCTTLICEIGEVSCGTITDSSVEFNWPAIPNAESYTYQYSIAGSAPISGSTTNTSLEVTGLEQGQIVSITIIPTSSSNAFCFETFATDCTTLICEIGEVTCGEITVETIEFLWPIIPNAQQYSYTYSINGSPGISGNTTENSLIIDDLQPESVVTITITPSSSLDTVCFESFSTTCVSEECPPMPEITVDQNGPVCEEGITPTFYVSVPIGMYLKYSINGQSPIIVLAEDNLIQIEVQNPQLINTLNIISIIDGNCEYNYNEQYELVYDVQIFENIQSSICTDGSIFLSAPAGFANYVWRDGDDDIVGQGQNIDIINSGNYTVSFTNDYCTYYQTFEINENPLPHVTINVVDNTIVINGLEEYQYALIDYDQNVLVPFQSSNTFSDLSFGIYYIMVLNTENGCIKSFEVPIIEINNVITPNYDGANEYFDLSFLNHFPESRVYIYDRYGKLIITLSPENNYTWDGKYMGRNVPSTSYWYKIVSDQFNLTGYILVKDRNSIN